MFNSLARLADRRPGRIGLIALAFFLLAGALGGSVADRLDPYGADDPATEAVKAREQLQVRSSWSKTPRSPSRPPAGASRRWKPSFATTTRSSR